MSNLIKPTVEFLTISLKPETDLSDFILDLVKKMRDRSEFPNTTLSFEEIISFSYAQATFLLGLQDEDFYEENTYLICDFFDALLNINGVGLAQLFAEKLVKQGSISEDDEYFQLLTGEKGLTYLKATVEVSALMDIQRVLTNSCLDSFNENFIQIAIDKKILSTLMDGVDHFETQQILKEHESTSEFIATRNMSPNDFILNRIERLEKVMFDNFKSLIRKPCIKDVTYHSVQIVTEEEYSKMNSLKTLAEPKNVIN